MNVKKRKKKQKKRKNKIKKNCHKNLNDLFRNCEVYKVSLITINAKSSGRKGMNR